MSWSNLFFPMFCSKIKKKKERIEKDKAKEESVWLKQFAVQAGGKFNLVSNRARVQANAKS